MKLQPRKKLRSPKSITKHADFPTELGIVLFGTMIIGLWCQPPIRTLEENFDQIFRVTTISAKIDLFSERTFPITTMIDTMITKQGHHTRQTKTNPGIREVTITFYDRLQRHDKTHPSLIFADNPYQIHLILQYLTGLEIETRATIYPATRSFQLPTLVTSQT